MTWPRGWLESLARGRTFWRRLPKAFGRTPILVSPDARLQHIKLGAAAFDSQLLRLAHDQVDVDSVVWDIGANVGVFSLAAASLAQKGYVLAVEPDPWLFGLLRKSSQHRQNRKLKLDTLCAALAAEPGTARLAIAKRGRSSNYLEQFGGRTQTGGVRGAHLVPVLTLDLLAHELPKPTLIKVDVEGAEWAVLEGGRDLVAQSRPIIAVEVDGPTRKDVTGFLQSLGYALHDQHTGAALSLEHDFFANVLAIPR